MATNVLPGSGPFTFQKNRSLFNDNGSLGFRFSSAAKADVAAALASDVAPFPARDIELGELGLTAATTKPIEFARGAGKVSFAAEGSTFAGFGIYRTGGALLRKLGDGAKDFSLEALEFGVDEHSLLAVLRWGYAADAKGSGAVALAPIASATLEIAGDSEGLFAVIRRLRSDMPARAIVQAAADSWVLPRQVGSIDQIEPGTWIVAEAVGGISVALGAQLGYDFNWVREAAVGGLTGDIGLRLQMGINAAVGFSASGRCAVVVSRDSEARTLRLRLFRLKTSGMDLSFDAALGLQANETLLPGTVDDFIAAVFDTHGQQILDDLKVLGKWTDPNAKLSVLLANAGVDGAEALIAALAGVKPAELQQRFDAVHAKAVTFIERWHGQPHTVASTVLKLVEEKVDLAGVRRVATALSTITTGGLQTLLDTELQRIDFFQTPVGRLLESIAGGSVLALLDQPLDQVRTVAANVLAVLDGGAVEATLRTFQTYLETALRLDRIFSVVNETDFAALDALLKKKLATFLGQDALTLPDLDKVRRAIGLLLQKREEYYEKAVDALHRKYNAELTASSQATGTGRALFDATFDFGHGPAAVAGFFQQALRGDLDGLLTVQPAQVSIAAGTLSHGISRQAHVDVSLPFMDSVHAHLNDSLATIDAVPHEGGLLIKLKASDAVTSGNQRKSTLSLAMGLAQSGQARVRLHQDSLALNYSLLFAKRKMQAKHVRAQVAPAIETFFSANIGSVDDFLDLLDRQAEALVPNGPNLLGDGLIVLDVSLPADAASAAGRAWLGLPQDRNADAYSRMSIAIQASLKTTIHDSVFGSPDGYTGTGVDRTQTFLAYCALAPRAQKELDWYWDWPDPEERRAMLRKPQTVGRMRELLARAQEVLRDDPGTAKHFEPDDAASILDGVDARDPFLNTLLVSENDVVQDAFKAGLSIAAGRAASPSAAVKALAQFGSKLTEAFHADITSLLGAGIRSLGTRVFLDASRAIDEAATPPAAGPIAMLSIEFLKPPAKFDEAALLAAGHVPADQLAFADRVVNVGRPA